MNNTVGHSEVTPFKQKDLDNILSVQIKKTRYVYKNTDKISWSIKNREVYCYFIDCSAGDMALDQQTSPSMFLKKLTSVKDLPIKLFLLEENPKIYSQLVDNFNSCKKELDTSNMKIYIRNHNMNKYLPKIRLGEYAFGLVYFDPNGFKLKDYEAIFNFLENNPRMDVLLNVSTTQIKRDRCLYKKKSIDNGALTKAQIEAFRKYDEFYFSTLLDRLNKKYIWIRDNIILTDVKSKHNFVMVFGTNTGNYIMDGDLSHFASKDDKLGGKLIKKYNYTKEGK